MELEDNSGSRMFKSISEKAKRWIIVLLGTLIRLYYVCAVPVVQTRQYDLGSAVPSDGIFTGHLGYMFYLFTYKRLPDFDPREVYQFFHPPLHHIIEALWMNIVNIFTTDFETVLEWLQIPTLIYSALVLVVAGFILSELKCKDSTSLIVLIILAFHPSYIFMAGSINNDGLALLFQFLIILFVIRWYKNRTTSNIIWIALSIGFGMLTKLSVALLAIPVAFVFISTFIEETREYSRFATKRFIQYLLFGIICVPIGMAWAVRCNIRFGMPLTYVNKLPNDSWQYIGNYSLWERFGVPNLVGLIKNLANGSLGFGENMWIQLFRTSALGECDLSQFPLGGKLIAMLMILVSGLIAIWALICFVKTYLIDKQKETTNRIGWIIKWFLILIYILSFGSYIKFCYSYPHQCTMNFRYMLLTVFIPAVGFKTVKDNKTCNLLGKSILLAYSCISIVLVGMWSNFF